ALLLGDAPDFSGTISGFAPVGNLDDIATAPSISAQNLDVTSVDYVDNGNHTGVLTLHNSGADIAINFDGDYTTANFNIQFDSLNTAIIDQGPAVSAAAIVANESGGNTTVSGLSIADLFDLTPSDHFAITMTAGNGTLSLANPGDA